MSWLKQRSELLTDRVRKHVIYRGRVQGVGFRATVQSIAAGFNLVGYVRNLPNGNVELVAEGSAGELQGFLDAIRERMDRFIDDAEIANVAAGEELQGFRIRY